MLLHCASGFFGYGQYPFQFQQSQNSVNVTALWKIQFVISTSGLNPWVNLWWSNQRSCMSFPWLVFQETWMNMTLHATVVIYVQKCMRLLKYMNEISIFKRQWSEENSFLFYCVIHISSHRYEHWPIFMQHVLRFDCLEVKLWYVLNISPCRYQLKCSLWVLKCFMQLFRWQNLKQTGTFLANALLYSQMSDSLRLYDTMRQQRKGTILTHLGCIQIPICTPAGCGG